MTDAYHSLVVEQVFNRAAQLDRPIRALSHAVVHQAPDGTVGFAMLIQQTIHIIRNGNVHLNEGVKLWDAQDAGDNHMSHRGQGTG